MKTIDLDLKIQTTVEYDYELVPKSDSTEPCYNISNIKVFAYADLKSLKNALETALAFGDVHHNPLVPINVFEGLDEEEQAHVIESCIDDQMVNFHHDTEC